MNASPSSTSPVTARLFIDPTCPFGYSASPALRTVEWRYRDQIEWQLVVIGMTEPGETPAKSDPAKTALHYMDLRDRYGMPFAIEPKVRPATSSRACQAIVAARLTQPGSQWKALRALHLLQFNTPLLIDDDEQLRAALSSVEGLHADQIIDSLDTYEVQNAYRTDWAESRTAEGGATEHQDKAADTSDGTRYTSPSVIFEAGLQRLEIGGFQPVEAYAAAIANLDPGLTRHAPPESPIDALKLYPGGLSTQEVAAIMAKGNVPADRIEAERQLVKLQGERRVKRIAMGNDAIWLAA